MNYQISIDRFQEIVLSIYDGPLSIDGWSSLLTSLCIQSESSAATLILAPPKESDPGQMVSIGLDKPEDEASEYAREFFPMDPFVNLPPDTPITLFEVIEESALIRTTFYKLCLDPIDVHHILGLDIYTDKGYRAGLRLMRPKGDRAFGLDEKRLCELILPHMKRALIINSLRTEVQSELELYSGAVTQLDIGTLIIDEKAHILKCNAVASAILSTKDGIGIRGNRLMIHDEERRDDFFDLLNSMTSQRVEDRKMVKAYRIPRLHVESPVGMVVRPINRLTWRSDDQQPLAMVFLRDPESGIQITEEILRELFALTKMEATVCRLLANGLTIEMICEHLFLSKSTVRTHLRATFLKTGVHHQSGLVKLVWSSIAHLGGSKGG